MTQVIINDVLPKTQIVATGGQTVFSTNWTANAASDVLVYSRAAGTDANDVTQLVSSSNYTVAFIGGSATVQVTLLTPSTLGDIVTIVRNTPASRLNLYTNTNFQPTFLNNDFGILTLVDQQAQLVNSEIAPRYNYSETIDSVVDIILPLLGANQTWVKNDDDTAFIPLDVPSTGFAPAGATYVLLTPDAGLANSFDLSAIGDGILINDTNTNTLLTRTFTGTANQIDATNGTGVGGNINVAIATNPIIPGTAGMGIPQGNTAQRVVPVSGINLRYNTDAGNIEFWDGVTWTQLQDATDFSSLPTGFMTVTTGSGALNSRLFVPTANQIDITNTDGAGDPTFSLSATMNLPGTFTIQGSTALDEIINDPTMATASATNISTSTALKTYIDSLVTGLNIQGSCVAASTVALTASYDNGASGVGATLTNAGAMVAISLDGVSPTVGDRVLIKNQASSLENGIYTVTVVGSGATNWVLTRATDYDTPAEIQPGDLVIITGGTTQTNSSWVETATVAAVGTDAITFVQFTASLPVNVASGGTGVTSFTAYGLIAGGTTATGSLQQVTIGSAGTILQSGGAAALPTFSTATYPSVATSTGSFIYANGTNFVASTSLWPNTVGTVGKIIRSDGTTNAYTTSTFADTYSASTILYSNGANTVTGLATGNNGILVTSNTGVPSIATTFGQGLAVASSVLSVGGENNIPFNDDHGLIDANGNLILTVTKTASAVNYISLINNATGSAPSFSAVGSDSNIKLNLNGKGTGGAQVHGTSTNDNATAGYVGEFVSNVVAAASAVSLTNSVVADLTSISLTAGDWDVWGNVVIQYTTNQGVTSYVWVSSTSATQPDLSLQGTQGSFVGASGTMVLGGGCVPQQRFSLSGTTTIYLSCAAGFTAGGATACGGIYARRVR